MRTPRTTDLTPRTTEIADTCDVADDDFGRAVRLGTAIGLPAIYVLTVLLALLGGASLGFALGVAAVPAIVGGPYMGGLMLMGRITHADDPTATVSTLSPRPSADRTRHAA